MKVTDEMEMAAGQELFNRVVGIPMWEARRIAAVALGAALADVDDGEWHAQCARSAERCWAVASLRAEAAEAKLAKVREWAGRHRTGLVAELALLAILDGE